LAKTVCLSLLELFQISFRHFVVLKLSFGILSNCNKFLSFGFLFSNMRAGSRFLSFCFDNCRTLTYGNVWCRHLAIIRVLNYVTGKNLNTCDTITYILTG